MRILISLLVLGLFTSCANVDKALVKVGEATGRKDMVMAGADLSPKQEYYLGRSMAAQVLHTSPAVKNDSIQDYLNKVGQYLVLHSTRPELFKGYHFLVVNDQKPSALSTPGGFIFISKAMFSSLESEDELAAVLAHEIAHIELKHAEDIIKKQKKTALVTDFLAKEGKKQMGDKKVPDEVYSWGSRSISSVINAQFEQAQEVKADRRALMTLKKAGYLPKALYDVLSRMKGETSFLSRHPSSESRVSRIKLILPKLKVRNTTNYRQVRFSKMKESL
ncbi:MAG: M48 family metalloprotease [Bdellovibrionales bacterium]|nr:M48 family metalloprotease [Bdellovibrionales bacterium]NQZ18479.1 M48 family metalloprotease [Bdellovibrionales bacterium]